MPHDAEVSEVMTDLAEVYWPAMVWVVERETKIIPPVLAALRASIAKATGGDL